MIRFDWPTERPYYASIVKVVDGDTVRARIDLGLRVSLGYPVRLIGLNCAPVGTFSGDGARAYVTSVLTPGLDVVLTTLKDYKYGGEFVGRIWLPGPDGVADFNQRLIDLQWAAAWDGNGAQPLPPWPRTVPL